jgi:DNA polymerase I-like protein with 3'-5' exonuclease and polymerase domains
VSIFNRLAARFIIPPASATVDGLRAVFDIEASGFLKTAAKIHCIVIADLDCERVDEYGPEQVSAALDHLARARYLGGHNVLNYDLPLLRRLDNWAPASGCVILDTLVASRTILPHLEDLDDEAGAKGDASLRKLRGRHSLEAWGARLGIPKVGTDIKDWSQWSPEMQERCVADVAINKALWHFLQPDGYSQLALQLEHRATIVCEQITADGAPFDLNIAAELGKRWQARRTELGASLRQQFPDLNFNSRKQLGALLEARGWVPEKRTEKTKQPVIDDEVLETIATLYPEFEGLAEYAILGRRLAQLSGGKQAWTKHVDSDGRIHGGLVHIGTPHSRAKHLAPNLAQVPNPKKGKPFASECRALFRAPEGWVCVAADQATLQDRGFAHYLTAFDGGAYAKAFLSGEDQHWKTATTLGLITNDVKHDKENKTHGAIRYGAKTFRYAFLYGCGIGRAGQIVGVTARAAQQIDANNDLLQRFFAGATHPPDFALRRVGKQVLDKFVTATPGLGQLRSYLKLHAKEFNWLPGLDGRRVPVRAQYTALNFVVTSSEAIICKRWLVQVYDELHARFRYGWDGDVVIVLWVHDEIVCCCRPEIAEQVGEILVRHAKEPAEFYGFKVPLDAEYRVGRSWAGDESPRPFSAPIVIHEHDEKARNSSMILTTAPPTVVTKPHVPLPELIGEALVDSKICCPFHDERTPSCHIYDDHFYCFGCNARGDAVDWLMMIEGLDRHAALQVLEGGSDLRPHTVHKPADDERNRRRALRFWDHAEPIAGTLAERYLVERRRIDLSTMPDYGAACLRFHPHCPFGAITAHPCLLVLRRDIFSDEPSSIHRIALTADGDKIERRLLGHGGIAKLWPAGPRLVVGEGVETTLAAATRISHRGTPLRPAWSAISSSALGSLPVIADVEELVILVDNDTNGAGQAAAFRCSERWSRAGKKVVRLTPKRLDSDFNDLIMESVS